MEKFTINRTDLPEVILLEPKIFADDRGFFLESYQRVVLTSAGIGEEFVQDNHSCSRRGVIRGLHYQEPHPQAKLVRVVRGSIFDVAVDLRAGSPRFGRYAAFILSAANHRMAYIPVGFAHGLLALEDRTEVLYKASDYYYPAGDGGIRWDDPTIGIRWPLGEHGIDRPLVSPKDAALPLLSAVTPPFLYPGGG